MIGIKLLHNTGENVLIQNVYMIYNVIDTKCI